ncbi:hypothetical protein ONE63_009120 [Megalurothrips usitatus]|uniref:Uncharacterized protein n=1 Tax=Megalurothrips usitatus TaxID=439358 RepID=A0AAV7XM25_9NEOP|nr:hypothetical protein ONE63_009120 [Megalurothrips usitatus]
MPRMDRFEIIRRLKRYVEVHVTKRRAFLAVVVFGLLLYFGPGVARLFYRPQEIVNDMVERCMEDRLTSFYSEASEYDANIVHSPPTDDEHAYLPYVGNGMFGLQVALESRIMLRSGRTLSLEVPIRPFVSVSLSGKFSEATVVRYLDGVVYRYQCMHMGLYVKYQYYAHRTIPGLLVQEIKVVNPSDMNLNLDVVYSSPPESWLSSTNTIRLPHGGTQAEFKIATGQVNVGSDRVMAVAAVTNSIPSILEVKARSHANIVVYSTVAYSKPMSSEEYYTSKSNVETQAIQHMKDALGKTTVVLRHDHSAVWNQLWSTGLRISQSLAAGALNGHLINATMYHVLSQSPSPYHATSADAATKAQVMRSLAYTEGCYSSYHTLQADNLWSDLSTLPKVNDVVSRWFLTLEKQGCHNLVKAGAMGVVQAMVLSFGGLRFSNQHLEFNIHPKNLHRDLDFRRLSYGNSSHVNISVIVQEDNHAVMYVALDRSDKNYYACDGGCLDKPVQLGPDRIQFPVKLTEPVTPILYITYDRQHMEDLRHAIHVKEIVEAPALEHHVIALHKHGHHLGGLPNLFWVSIGVLIVVFHLFLFKLIYNEYKNSTDKFRTRYGKL